MRKDDALGRALAHSLEPVAFTPDMQRRVLARTATHRRATVQRLTAAVLFALLMLACLTAAAVTLRGSVIDYLFGRSDAQIPEEALSAVQPVALTASASSVTVTAHDALFDGETLSLGLSVDAEKPLYIVLDSLTVNGVPFDAASSNMTDMWTSSPLGAQVAPFTHGLTVVLDKGHVRPSADASHWETISAAIHADGHADVELSLCLLAPKQMARPIDRYTGESADIWSAIERCVAAGDTPIDADEPHEALVSRAYFGANIAESDPIAVPLGDAHALTAFANMACVLEARFAFRVTCTVP